MGVGISQAYGTGGRDLKDDIGGLTALAALDRLAGRHGFDRPTHFQSSQVAKGSIEGHKVTLLKDVAMLDQMYDMNLAYFKELTMYILAGKKKLKETEETELPALREKGIKTH